MKFPFILGLWVEFDNGDLLLPAAQGFSRGASGTQAWLSA
jgi:hypothetical protein